MAEGQVFKCDLCEVTYKSVKALKIHFTKKHDVSYKHRRIEQKHISQTYMCSKCDKKFDEIQEFTCHKRSCSNFEQSNSRDRIPCTVCSETFYDILRFENHLSVKHCVQIAYKCKICEKEFRNALALKQHGKRHSARIFKCKLCSKNYSERTSLVKHIEKVHTTSSGNLCRDDDSRRLKVSSVVEAPRQGMQCNYCDYRTTRRSNFRLHQYVHEGKPYKCNQCCKSFVIRRDMRLHALRIHQTELSEPELAAMFRDHHGYWSRADVFPIQ